MRLNETAHRHARKAIVEGKAVVDERDDWSEHQPSAAHLHGMLDELKATQGHSMTAQQAGTAG